MLPTNCGGALSTLCDITKGFSDPFDFLNNIEKKRFSCLKSSWASINTVGSTCFPYSSLKIYIFIVLFSLI